MSKQEQAERVRLHVKWATKGLTWREWERCSELDKRADYQAREHRNAKGK